MVKEVASKNPPLFISQLTPIYFREHVGKQRAQSQRLDKTHRHFQIKTQELD